jgi:CRISPR/Cas system-associated endonuclease Cas1
MTEETKELSDKEKQIIEKAELALFALGFNEIKSTSKDILRRKQHAKAYEEERKEFWKAVYIASINNEHCRSYKTFHYADEALEEFDKRFKKH